MSGMGTFGRNGQATTSAGIDGLADRIPNNHASAGPVKRSWACIQPIPATSYAADTSASNYGITDFQQLGESPEFIPDIQAA